MTETKQMTFADLNVGDEFDWVSPEIGRNSFFDTCRKTSARGYVSTQTGAKMTVGSVKAKVYHVRHANPTKRTGITKTAYVKRPSQATQSAPSKRLVKRRKANVVGSGRFPNPSKPKWAFDAGDADKNIYSVHAKHGKSYSKIAEFKDYKKAVEYAEAYANAHEKQMKVTGNIGKAGSRVKSGTINRSW